LLTDPVAALEIEAYPATPHHSSYPVSCNRSGLRQYLELFASPY
jgi:hypothetical protein